MLNRPWFKQKRGGIKTREAKEGRVRLQRREGSKKEEITNEINNESEDTPKEEKKGEEKVKEVEGVVFVPCTPSSKLRVKIHRRKRRKEKKR